MATSSAPGSSDPQQNTEAVHPALIVVRATGLPRIETVFREERKYYVTATDGVNTERTSVVQSRGQSVEWGETLRGFTVIPSSRLIVRVFARRTTGKDILLAPVALPFESLRPFSLQEFDLPVDPIQRTTLVLSLALPEAPQRATTSVISSPEVSVVPGEAAAQSGALPVSPADQTQVAAERLTEAEEAIANLKSAPGLPLRLAKAADEAPGNLGGAIEVYDTWSIALDNVKWVVDVVDKIAEIHPWAKMAWSVLSCIPKTFIAQVERDESFMALLVAIRDAFDLAELATGLERLQPRSVQATIMKRMLYHVCECGDLIQNYAKNADFWKRFMQTVGRGASEQVKSYSDTLTKLRDDFLRHGAITTEMTVLKIPARIDALSSQLERVASGVADVGMIVKIGEIPYPEGTRFRPDKRCSPGTRVAFLDYVTDWVNNPESSRALVLFGESGTGKSSIANEIAYRFYQTQRLGSSFAFSRTERSNRHDYLLFTGLVRDLADRYPSFRASLGRIIDNDTSLRHGARDYATIFESMLLQSLEGVPLIGPVLIVIDALDESGDASGSSGLHTFLASRIPDLPPNFRVFITSRSEENVTYAFNKAAPPPAEIWHMEHPLLSSQAAGDIRSYMQHKLPSDLFESYGAKLAEKSVQSFQWAAVASDYIQGLGQTSLQSVDNLLELPQDAQVTTGALDSLYKTVLSSYFNDDNVLTLFRSVMGQLVAAIEPLSVRSLAELRQYGEGSSGILDEQPIRAIVSQLGSLLNNAASSDSSLPISPLHTSFHDFLTDPKRAGKFCVDLEGAHCQLAYCSLGLMHHKLRFNICRLPSSYNRNAAIPDLLSRIARHISSALSYACRCWDDHLRHVSSGVFLGKVLAFFENDFPFWLEALSLLGATNLAPQAFSTVEVWHAKQRDRHPLPVGLDTLMMWTNDVSKFVGYFGIPIAQSAPHIYLSALPFAPETSMISRRFFKWFPKTLRLNQGRMSHWPAQEMVIPTEDMVVSVAYSPDGQYIAAGVWDEGICVWDAKTGQIVAGPFIGHTKSVNSVAFSPDGRRLASGSEDHTILIWDTKAGQVVAGPFKAHTGPVNSVAFSPDGHQVASGSNDRTIRIWDAETGHAVAGPFTGHTGWVLSVVFSPNGLYIASGAADSTVRTWDAETGQTITGPFVQHTDRVYSVAFSPDGCYIASGSSDRTVRVWDAKTGQSGDPFTGHTDEVMSVTFSPDGIYVASGSIDTTVRVWNARASQVAVGAFTGHTLGAFSIAFSPDGRHVASGSPDRSIRIWDIMAGQVAADPSTAHTAPITSVVFSYDGQRVASASGDTVRIWDGKTGQPVAGPFTGHTDVINSIAFSPDGQRVASGSHDYTIRVWDARTGETVADPFTGHTSSVASVAWSPDGRHIASCSQDSTIRIWDATRGQTDAVTVATGHTHKFVNCVAFSPDGQRVVSGSGDCTVRIWDTKTGDAVAGPFMHTDWVRSVAFSPDGRHVASGSDDLTIRVWDAYTGEPAAGPFKGHEDRVLSVVFSPDGRSVASGSMDCTVRVWDSKTGQSGNLYTGNTGGVASVAFSPDGKYVASGSSDKTMQLWSIKTEGGLSDSEPSSSVYGVAHGGSADSPPNFADQTITHDGWIVGTRGELLVWIPEPHRAGLYRPGVTVWVVAEKVTRLDTSNFVHGTEWAMCYAGETRTL